MKAKTKYSVIYTNGNNCVIPSEMEVGEEKNLEFSGSGLKFDILVKRVQVDESYPHDRFTLTFSDRGQIFAIPTVFACTLIKIVE